MTAIEFNNELILLQRKLKGFALKLTCDAEQADDLLQDTILKAMENRGKFRAGTNLNAWLLTMMRNIFINNYRRKTYSNAIFDKSADCYEKSSSVQLSDNRNNPVSQISYQEILTKIENLSEKTRDSFKMFTEGYQYSEIAQELNVPVGTIKSRIFNTRKQMMRELVDFVD